MRAQSFAPNSFLLQNLACAEPARDDYPLWWEQYSAVVVVAQTPPLSSFFGLIFFLEDAQGGGRDTMALVNMATEMVVTRLKAVAVEYCGGSASEEE